MATKPIKPQADESASALASRPNTVPVVSAFTPQLDDSDDVAPVVEWIGIAQATGQLADAGHARGTIVLNKEKKIAGVRERAPIFIVAKTAAFYHERYNEAKREADPTWRSSRFATAQDAIAAGLTVEWQNGVRPSCSRARIIYMLVPSVGGCISVGEQRYALAAIELQDMDLVRLESVFASCRINGKLAIRAFKYEMWTDLKASKANPTRKFVTINIDNVGPLDESTAKELDFQFHVIQSAIDASNSTQSSAEAPAEPIDSTVVDGETLPF